MSDKLYPLSLGHLISWMLEEIKSDHLLGIPRELWFEPGKSDPFTMMRYGQFMETPIGVAAGPHTQLSQNIIAAWICGARYMELKTVQTLDELEISKPCIDMQDEGYNCEWSQELKLRQSLDEYLNAWIAIHILKDHLGWDSSKGSGVIFNMSVGYDLKGIMNANVQEFMARMGDSQALLDQKLEELSPIYPRVKNLNISGQMTDNITLSTMHGCPPDEIERIAEYLIKDRKLHTAVKLNPTLLGPDTLRSILNDKLGYDDVRVPDLAFEHDLKYPDAIQLIQNLQKLAQTSGVEFGLKLTNTLEVENHRPIFPAHEKMMYLSGRALHPLSIKLAAKLQNDFQGALDLSFSAGADAFNVTDILACNLRPVTTCSDVLKPGGYTRLKQYLDNIEAALTSAELESLEKLVTFEGSDTLEASGLQKLIQYSESVVNEPRYQKHSHHFDSIKTQRKLGQFDCIDAPCVDACAANQNIPEYLYQTSQGRFDKAFEAIQQTNPLPGVTGHVCDHLCQLKCTRNNYDNPLLIREIKRFVTELQIPEKKPHSNRKHDLSIAVIGAGPAGLSCAYFLARTGVSVNVFEAKPFVGGMVSDAIPQFRLSDEVIDLDVEVLRQLGVIFHFGYEVDKTGYAKICAEYDDVFIAVGAQRSLQLGVAGEELPQVLDPLHFLSDVRQGARPELGQRIAVIGGGNTAMDAARTALRLAGAEAEVMVLYRRTMKEMPADIDEIEAALAEGIAFHELVSPISFKGDQKLTAIECQKMTLGEPDASGRRRPIPLSGETFRIPVDTVILAIGQAIRVDFIEGSALQVNPRTGATQHDHIYAGGDAVRGASSVINAIGDGQIAARHILKRYGIDVPSGDEKEPRNTSIQALKVKAGKREYGMEIPLAQDQHNVEFPMVHRSLKAEEAIHEASRCLLCDDYCSVCVGVCPNLANLTYLVKAVAYPVHEASLVGGKTAIIEAGNLSISQEPQVLNIADFCNECGNCSTFCPTAGDPYIDKPRIHLSPRSFDGSNTGYHFRGETLTFKSPRHKAVLTSHDGDYLYQSQDGQARFDGVSKDLDSLNLEKGTKFFSTLEALEMIVLYESLRTNPLIEFVPKTPENRI
jgi:putative selenate reductase